MKPILELLPLLSRPRQIAIIMHQKPDADAMGSSLALFHYFQLKHHQVAVVSPTLYPDFLKWMPGAKEVIIYELHPEKATEALQKAEIIFCMDFNAFHRARPADAALAQSAGIKVIIDHHLQPEPVFEYGLSDVQASSTAELVYEVIIGWGDKSLINNEIAQCIYAGTMTDTGSFRFAATSARVHRMVADLMEHGLRHEPIHQAIYDNFLENRLRFLGYVLSNRMEVFYEYNAALITVPASDVRKFNLSSGDTEGLVNYPLSIQGIKLSALMVENHQEIRISLRSKGDFDVNEFARKYFNGGGHLNAAGGRSTDSLEATVARFKKALEENKALLEKPLKNP
ncbi:phosphoesterase RecJ-like protein [Thermoflavifilum aggregans]|uniref:Phosphoesterase RecJ-like protein n=1 Tax=Thermoflavifilum aggregans TaxID=454188 RepID=A0A2M9CUG6_9BACT|nr:bifunctional oligoribonuclease/PAP phosphatase NrnA [Thermoflavifilum aggregans]PJJ75519.1 phosphoesterase RecJ-like protein [Thermoflavifilum aggregans]